MRIVARSAAILAAGAALLAVLAQGADAQSTPEKRKVNVATASLGLPYLPLIIAQQRKYFADEGLEVEIAAFAGGSKALQSLMGGSSDVASGAFVGTLFGTKVVHYAHTHRQSKLDRFLMGGLVVAPMRSGGVLVTGSFSR